MLADLLKSEDLIPLSSAVALFPPVAGIDAKALARWCVRGVRGIRLPARRIGAKWYTTAAAVESFLARLNGVEADCVVA